MSAIEASSAGVKDMADGSLRITIEFEPRHAKEAFSLFGARGTPLAVVALTVGYAAVGESVQAKPSIAKTETTRPGPLCEWVVRRCGEPEFFSWIAPVYHAHIGDLTPDDFVKPSDFCRHAVMVLCECDESRKEIDTDKRKAQLFHELIRGPYSKHLTVKGLIT